MFPVTVTICSKKAHEVISVKFIQQVLVSHRCQESYPHTHGQIYNYYLNLKGEEKAQLFNKV